MIESKRENPSPREESEGRIIFRVLLKVEIWCLTLFNKSTIPKAISAATANISAIARGKLERTDNTFLGKPFKPKEPSFLPHPSAADGGGFTVPPPLPPPASTGVPPGSGASIFVVVGTCKMAFLPFFLLWFSEVLSLENTVLLLLNERVSVSMPPFLQLQELYRIELFVKENRFLKLKLLQN
ncbi:disintegrin and metalloproteinase [Striga asiatica]|uniref:Disintegrin and metalloproteinase n=1 Tax=Striga asiatica TaxID=4170 RepID=A0A5A7QZ79_STRAF|nr:disintegrin and metalloproteinase [Striga asiatica]